MSRYSRIYTFMAILLIVKPLNAFEVIFGVLHSPIFDDFIFVVIIYCKSSLHNYTKLEKMHYLIMYFVNLVRIKFLVESFNTFGRPQPVTGAGKFETLKIPPPFKNGKNRLKGVFLAIMKHKFQYSKM